MEIKITCPLAGLVQPLHQTDGKKYVGYIEVLYLHSK
jgi:hypothetical protein